jgi:hypothetical protein
MSGSAACWSRALPVTAMSPFSCVAFTKLNVKTRLHAWLMHAGFMGAFGYQRHAEALWIPS